MKVRILKDQIHKNIIFSELEAFIFEQSIFNRLHFIIQNSMSFYVYPTNKTSRFIHSVGVMDVTTSIFINSLKNANVNDVIKFLSFYKDDIENFVKDFDFSEFLGKNAYGCRGYVKKFNLRDLFNSIEKINGVSFINHFSFYNKALNEDLIVVYYLLLISIRLAALFHDLGHLPFSHLFENAIGRYFSELDETDKNYNKLFKIINSGDDIHEFVGKKLSFLLLKLIVYKHNDCKDILLLLIIKKIVENILTDEKKYKCLHRIFASDFDADRIDYVIRDSFASFFIENGCDIDRILKTFILIKKDDFEFLPSIQALNEIDDFYLQRDKLYSSVINHHKVRKFDTLLERLIVFELQKKEKLNELIDMISELINLNKNDKQIEDIFFRFSKINDDWLLGILRDRRYHFLKNNEENIYTFLLDEFFAGKKELKSLWKREYEYYDFLEKLIQKLKSENYFSINENDSIEFKALMKKISDFSDYEKAGALIEFLNKTDWMSKLEKKLNNDKNFIIISDAKKQKYPKNLKLVDIANLDVFDYKSVTKRKISRKIMFFIYSKGIDLATIQKELIILLKEVRDVQSI